MSLSAVGTRSDRSFVSPHLWTSSESFATSANPATHQLLVADASGERVLVDNPAIVLRSLAVAGPRIYRQAGRHEQRGLSRPSAAVREPIERRVLKFVR